MLVQCLTGTDTTTFYACLIGAPVMLALTAPFLILPLWFIGNLILLYADKIGAFEEALENLFSSKENDQ